LEQERTLALRLPGMLAPDAVLARCLHYFEEQGLIEPGRLANGYLTYDEYLVNRAIQLADSSTAASSPGSSTSSCPDSISRVTGTSTASTKPPHSDAAA
jgi:hypothetical protein